MKAAAVIVAGGKSIRFGGETPKQFVRVGGRMLLAWTIDKFEVASSIASIVVVVPSDAVEEIRDMVSHEKYTKVSAVTSGGETRSQSVLAGLRGISGGDGLVAIHDGARPLVSPTDIDRVVSAAGAGDAAILAIPASDAIKKTANGVIRATVDRDNLYYAQTPQVFELKVIRNAHEMRGEQSFADDAALVEEQGVRVRVIEPTHPNIKVTRPEDLLLIEHLLIGGGRG